MGNSKPIAVGFVGVESCGFLTLVLVVEATSEVLGLGFAQVLVALGGLRSGIPAGLCGLRPLVLVLVLLDPQLDVSSPFLFVIRIKIRLPDPLADRLLAILEIRHKVCRPPKAFGRATPAAAKGIATSSLKLEAQRGRQVFGRDPSGSGRGPSGPQFAHLVVLHLATLRCGVAVAVLDADTVAKTVCSSNLLAILTIRNRPTRQWQNVFLGEGVNYIDEQLGTVVNGAVSARVDLNPILEEAPIHVCGLENNHKTVYRRNPWKLGSDLSHEILVRRRPSDHNGPFSEGEEDVGSHIIGRFRWILVFV